MTVKVRTAIPAATIRGRVGIRTGRVRQKVLRRMIESEADASRDELRRSNQLTPANYDFKLLRLDQRRPARLCSRSNSETKSQY